AGGPVGQLQAEFPRDQFGVVEEDFVEGADPEEEDHAGVGVAQREILADQFAVGIPALPGSGFCPRRRARHRYASSAVSSAARPVRRSRSRVSATARASAASSPTIT